MFKKIKRYKNNNQWFWKIDKSDYNKILKRLSQKNQKKRIEKYKDEIVVYINWTLFYEKKQFYFLLCYELYYNTIDFVLQSIINQIQFEEKDENQQHNYIKNK